MPRHLSKRALKLLDRLYDGHWYPMQYPEPTGAMKELVDAGFVIGAGRVQVISTVYVPKGTTAFKLEKIPKKPKWLKKALAE
jgi:hypothetical protein